MSICKKLVKICPECLKAYVMLRTETLKNGKALETTDDGENDENEKLGWLHSTTRTFRMRILRRCWKKSKAAKPLRDWEEGWLGCRRKDRCPPLRCYSCYSSDFFQDVDNSGMEL